MSAPLISVITVVYNGQQYLAQTIQSIMAQSYKNIEYIIIDGGSTDGTVDIIRKYEKHISKWISEPDKGLYDAMNKGIQMASGDYIGIVNADDYYEPNTVELIVNELGKGNTADVFFGDLFFISPYFPKKVLLDDYKGQNLEQSLTIWHPTVFVKRICYQTYGGFDLQYRIAADYDLLLRYKRAGLHFHYINAPLSNFRIDGLSSYNIKAVHEKYKYQKKGLGFVREILKLYLQRSLLKVLGQKKYQQFRYKYLFSKYKKIDF
jgi:glycosyltransferase involved in cell wall biosynthesis